MNCFNGERFMRDAIDSVLAQTYREWELIFWDNLSTDRSAAIFRSYSDPRLRYFHAPRHALLYDARNQAIAQARGEFLAFLDVDDWWAPDKLERQVPLFGDPAVGFVCGDFWIVDDRTGTMRRRFRRPAPTGTVLNDLLGWYFVGILTLIIRRAALDSLDHPCDPRYHIIGDFDLVMRLAARWKAHCVQEPPVAFYRRHDSTETSRSWTRRIRELELWVSEMRGVSEIGGCPNFAVVVDRLRYMQGLQAVLEGNAMNARSHLGALRWGALKLRLLAAMAGPRSLAERLKI